MLTIAADFVNNEFQHILHIIGIRNYHMKIIFILSDVEFRF